MAEESGYVALQGAAHFQLGIQYKSSMELHLAAKSYSRAIECFRRSGHADLEARARFNLAILYRKLGHLRRAKTEVESLLAKPLPTANSVLYLNEFARLFLALEDRPRVQSLLMRIHVETGDNTLPRSRVITKELEADILALEERWHFALDSIDEGLVRARALSPRNDLVGELLRRKARVLMALGEDEQAFATAKEALEICEAVGEIYEIGALFRILGLLAERRHDTTEAENLLLKAAEFYRDKDEKYERALCHRELADFYRRAHRARRRDDDLREAFRHAATALGLFDEMGMGARRAEVQTLLDDVARRLPSRPFTPPDGEALAAIGQRHGIITGDPTLTRLLETVATLAPSDNPILVTGETGTGKELFARAIHDLSRRAGGPLVVVNCAAIPDELMESELFGHLKGSFTGAHRDRLGKFAQADGGTLFLDEIGDLSPRLQAKLLRVLQDGIFSPVGSDESVQADVRVISATNRDLESLIADGRFRKDLLYRLNGVTLALPPLRKRGDDVGLLARYFLHEEAERLGRRIELDSHALDRIRAYPWPGNVRELQNFIRRMALFAMETGRLTVDLFPASYLTPIDGYNKDLATILLEAEREAVLNALARSGGNKAAAARLLGISRSTINEKIRRYDLPPDFYARMVERHKAARA